jgi:type IV pilus assembly protein PilM
VGLFRKKRTPELGLDISSTAVKLLELGRQDNRFRVESYAVEPLPANAVVEKNIANMEAVAVAIKAAVKRAGAKGKHVAIAVPASSAISKTVSMPADLAEDELEAQIELQADQHVPYPLEEVHLDFQVIGPSQHSDEVDVLLVASRSENVESRVAAVEAAGLIPRVVDVESYALENAYPVLAEQLPGGRSTVAIADIGATMTTLTVLEGGKIIYARDQVFGGLQLTEEIMRRYGLSFEEAGRAKRQGGLPDGYEEEVLVPFKEAMAQQVMRSLQFFFGSGQHGSVDHILLGGGCAAIPGAAELIEEHTGTGTTVANPFGHMALASRIRPQRLAEDAPALLIACGLAMRSFD